MNEKPILIDSGGSGRVAVRWKNTAGIGERPRLVAVEWRAKKKEDRRPRREEPKAKKIARGVLQGPLL